MTPARRLAHTLVLSACAALLVACGGGGDAGSTPGASKAEGVYGGTLAGSSSNGFRLLVLENDEFWSLYGTNSGNTFAVAGLLQGQGVSNNGSFISTNTKDFTGSSGTFNASVAATYVPATSVNGTITEGASVVSLTGTTLNSSTYNYASPASLASVIGVWTTTALNGLTVTLNVASNGGFTALASNGCSISGTIVPRPSGKNVFNVALTFGPAPCGTPGVAGQGVALAYPVGASQQLLVTVTDATRANGTALIGIR